MHYNVQPNYAKSTHSKTLQIQQLRVTPRRYRVDGYDTFRREPEKVVWTTSFRACPGQATPAERLAAHDCTRHVVKSQ